MKPKSFSYSKILDYSACPRMYYLRYVAGIYPKDKAKALSFGYCIANALRTYRAEASFEKASNAFIESWEEDGRILKAEEDPDDPKDFRTVRRGLEILDAYVKEYPDEPGHIIRPEVRFELDFGEVGNHPVIVVGRIDGVISDERGGARIIEDKTTSRLGPFFLEQLRGSLQIGLYLYAAEEYGLFEIGGNRVTPSCLMNAMKVHPKEFKFMRELAIKSRKHLGGFRSNTLRWITQIIHSEETECFPMNDIDNSQCTKYGGCDYQPLKYASGNAFRAVLKSGYIRKYKEGEEYKVADVNDDDIDKIQEMVKEV